MRIVLGALLAITCVSCSDHGARESHETRESRVETVNIDRDKAEMVSVEMTLAAGKLDVEGGASKLLEGTFRYNEPSWKPKVRYDTSSFRGRLTIDQGTGQRGMDGGDAEWRVKLSNDVPMDLNVRSGATEARLKVGSLDLRKLEFHVGVGKVELDLRGTPKRGYDVELKGGVGEAVVYLPSGVNISADAQGGIGEIQVDGLEKQGGRYVRRVSQIGAPTVRVDVHGGIGSIKLIAE